METSQKKEEFKSEQAEAIINTFNPGTAINDMKVIIQGANESLQLRVQHTDLVLDRIDGVT